MITRRPWQEFYEKSIRRIIDEKESILDIGGALRVDGARSNRVDAKQLWVFELIREQSIKYRVLDVVPTYHPDIIGDIQHLPLPDGSEDAIICVSVLEHVENPFLAAAELYRVLKHGGYCFVYVPFLFYYHAEKGYYGDYWRFTEDSLRLLFKPFSAIELCKARGPLETLVRLSPLGRRSFFCSIGFLVDRFAHKLRSSQTSGFYLLATK